MSTFGKTVTQNELAPDVRELVRVLRITSNSLNQLTKRVHETGSIYSEDIEDLRKSYDRLWGAAEEIMLRIAAV